MWGKVIFGLIMGFGVIISIMAGLTSMAWFFIIICGVTIWLITKEKKRVALDKYR